MDQFLKVILGVLEFLLPEKTFSLSWVFVVVFVGIWIIGWIQYKRRLCDVDEFCEKALAEYATKKELITCNEYVDNFDIELASRDVSISDLPNIFVTVGLIGTFIGLGVALQGAADLLNTDKIDIAQLNSVLGILAFKFKTSVWGMVLSISAQKLFVQNYFELKDGKLCKLKDQLAELVGKRSDVQLQDSVEKIYAGMSQYNDSSDKFLDLVNKLGVILSDMSNSLLKQQQSYVELVKKEQDWYDESIRDFKAHLKQYQYVFLRGSNTYIKHAHEELYNSLRKCMSEVHDNCVSEAVRIGDTISAYNVSVEAFREVLESIKKEMGEIVSSNQDSRQAIKKLQEDNYKDIQSKIDAIKDRIIEMADTSICSKIGTTCDSLQSMVGKQKKIENSIDRAVLQINQENGKQLEKLSKNLAEYTGTINGSCTKLEEVQKNVLEKIPTAEDLRKPLSESQDMLKKAIIETLQNYESKLLPLQKLEQIVAALENDKELVRQILLRELLNIADAKDSIGNKVNGVSADEKKD